MHQIQSVGNFFPDVFVGVEAVARLIERSRVDGFADFEIACCPARPVS
jgi:hypothetical protein